jgi:murein DD-endopeptidase MepM/ murein hydrolase activator NlpD
LPGVGLRGMRFACLALGLLWTALASGEVLYRLPWADGLSFMFTQAPGGRITSHFTRATLHAVDIAMPEGVPILAARGGIVEETEAFHGASPDEEPLTFEGNFVRVRHADGTWAIYAHLKHQGVAVAAGDAVGTGQLLGYSGVTGDALDPHLHFAVMREDASVPFQFYVGAPPVPFRPRAAVLVKANYSTAAETPRAPSETSLFPWKRPALGSEGEAKGWQLLGFWFACGIAALLWFWRFSRK